jgi:hypothetical protein
MKPRVRPLALDPLRHECPAGENQHQLGRTFDRPQHLGANVAGAHVLEVAPGMDTLGLEPPLELLGEVTTV